MNTLNLMFVILFVIIELRVRCADFSRPTSDNGYFGSVFVVVCVKFHLVWSKHIEKSEADPLRAASCCLLFRIPVQYDSSIIIVKIFVFTIKRPGEKKPVVE